MTAQAGTQAHSGDASLTPSAPEAGDTQRLLYGPDAVALLDAGKPVPPSDPVSIDEAFVQGDRLTVHVRYYGGGKEHAFRIVSSGALMKSLPPQMDLFLIHRAHGDKRGLPIAEELYFDLRPIRARYPGTQLLLHLHAGDSQRAAVPPLQYSK